MTRHLVALVSILAMLGWTPVNHAQATAESQTPAVGSAPRFATTPELEKAWAAKDWPRAIELLDKQLQLQPDVASGWYMKGQLLDMLSRFDEAVVALRRSAELAPDNVYAATALCWEQILAGEPVAARPDCERSLALRRDVPSTVNLGHIALLLADEPSAYRYYRDALTLAANRQEIERGPLADFDRLTRLGRGSDAIDAAKQWMSDGIDKVLEARSLNQSAVQGFAAGRLSSALPQSQQALALFEQVLGPDHPELATILGNLAKLHEDMGRNDLAIPLRERALAVTENSPQRRATEHAKRMGELAAAYRTAGRYADALPLLESALSLSRQIDGKQSLAVGLMLVRLADLRGEMAQYPQALELAQRSVDIIEAKTGPDSANLLPAFSTLVRLYQVTGERARALPLAQRAVALAEKSFGVDGPNVGGHLKTLASLYQDAGDYKTALPLYQRALVISEKASGPDHPNSQMARNSLADQYRVMGDYAMALALYERGLAIAESSYGPDDFRTSDSLAGMARTYAALSQYERALPLAKRALVLRERAQGPEHPNVVALVSDLASLHDALGQFEQAKLLYLRALAISERVHGQEDINTILGIANLAIHEGMRGHTELALTGVQRAQSAIEKTLGSEHPELADLLNSKAKYLDRLGRHDEALAALYRAEAIAAVSGIRDYLAAIQSGLANQHQALGQPDLAIFWGKQSVNGVQSMRAGTKDWRADLRLSFMEGRREPYKVLSALLIQQARIPEAQRVMAMLKEDEYFEFVRRDDTADRQRGQLPLTGVERLANEGFYAAREQLSAVAKQVRETEARRDKGVASPDDMARLPGLQSQLADARSAFDAFVGGLSMLLAGDTVNQNKAQLTQEQLQSHQNMLADLGPAGQGVAAVQYIISKERLHIVVSIPNLQVAREVQIGEPQLNVLVAGFRDAVQNPRADPRPSAQALHRLLIDPIHKDLQAQGIHTLMLVLDGALRYVPFAALHDGNSYLVEQFQTAIYTEAARSRLAAPSQGNWRIAALGVTRAFPEQNFRALPAVKGELEGIVRPEVLPGLAYLDDNFTLAALQQNMNQPVLHIASHFKFVEGSDDSFLLLGDGSRLTLRQVRTTLPRFSNVDLLTLSACDTATGGGRRENGLEVEGLGVLAQQRGAKAVLASLWPVADASTGELMQRFYRERQGGQRNKAEALRQAQLSLLRGGSAPVLAADADADAERSVERPAAMSPSSRTAVDVGKPFAHPYFWAPFILMGNWL